MVEEAMKGDIQLEPFVTHTMGLEDINKAFDLSSNSHSQDSINIGNNPICEQISKMNQTIVSSFINVYDILEKKGDLKRLHQILGEIEFE